MEYRAAAENDTAAEQAAAGFAAAQPAAAESQEHGEIPPVTWDEPEEMGAGTGTVQPTAMSHAAAAAETGAATAASAVAPAGAATMDLAENTVDGISETESESAEASAEIKDKGEEVPQIRKPFFSHFKPHTVVFNRNGFPRKNADLRVALSQMREEAGAEKETGVEKEAEKPDENKES